MSVWMPRTVSQIASVERLRALEVGVFRQVGELLVVGNDVEGDARRQELGPARVAQVAEQLDRRDPGGGDRGVGCAVADDLDRQPGERIDIGRDVRLRGGQRRPSQRPDDPVRVEAVLRLVGDDRGLRELPEDAVRVERRVRPALVESLLELDDRRAARPLAECRAGLLGRRGGTAVLRLEELRERSGGRGGGRRGPRRLPAAAATTAPAGRRERVVLFDALALEREPGEGDGRGALGRRAGPRHQSGHRPITGAAAELDEIGAAERRWLEDAGRSDLGRPEALEFVLGRRRSAGPMDGRPANAESLHDRPMIAAIPVADPTSRGSPSGRERVRTGRWPTGRRIHARRQLARPAGCSGSSGTGSSGRSGA